MPTTKVGTSNARRVSSISSTTGSSYPIPAARARLAAERQRRRAVRQREDLAVAVGRRGDGGLDGHEVGVVGRRARRDFDGGEGV